jgi:hypothetical protein
MPASREAREKEGGGADDGDGDDDDDGGSVEDGAARAWKSCDAGREARAYGGGKPGGGW